MDLYEELSNFPLVRYATDIELLDGLLGDANSSEAALALRADKTSNWKKIIELHVLG